MTATLWLLLQPESVLKGGVSGKAALREVVIQTKEWRVAICHLTN